MSALIATRLAEHKVVLHHAPEIENPSAMTFFFLGLQHTVERKEAEAQADFWIRVLGVIASARLAVQCGRTCGGDYSAWVDCYAGAMDAQSVDALHRYHLQQHILTSLNEIASSKSKRRGDATAKIKALALMATMTGMAPVKKTRSNHVPLPPGTLLASTMPAMQFVEPPPSPSWIAPPPRYVAPV